MSEGKVIDKTVAGILALLLGGIGIHKFYMGNSRAGILYLCFFWTGIPATLGLIEGIIYLITEDAEFQAKYTDPNKFFLDLV